MNRPVKEFHLKAHIHVETSFTEEDHAIENTKQHLLHFASDLRFSHSRNLYIVCAESERSTTLDTLAEGRAEWRPAVPTDNDLVRAIEAVEGTYTLRLNCNLYLTKQDRN